MQARRPMPVSDNCRASLQARLGAADRAFLCWRTHGRAKLGANVSRSRATSGVRRCRSAPRRAAVSGVWPGSGLPPKR
jgi:hypothetical protein